MSRPIQAQISLAAIRSNLALVRRHAPGARVWGVVKANAYGHGVARVLPAMRQADGLALLDLEEAELLRALGYAGPILLLEGFFSVADLGRAMELGLDVVVHCNEQLQILENWSGPGRVNVYLKMNSGMNRLGFRADAMSSCHARLRALATVGQITLMTHFAQGESTEDVTRAVGLFNAATQGLAGERSLSNSAATLLHARARGDWVRPGIALYGASPLASRSAAALGLTPAMTLRSELIAVRDLAPGDAIGYGGRFVADQPMRIGVVACGYADGYPRAAADGTPVMVAGTRTRLVGMVSMDMLTVDLAPVPDAQVGTPVELWGAGLSVDEVAVQAGSVGYELLCALARRVPVHVAE
jgi:alanine racemase